DSVPYGPLSAQAVRAPRPAGGRLAEPVARPAVVPGHHSSMAPPSAQALHRGAPARGPARGDTMNTATALAGLSGIKARQQETWASGDFALIASRVVLVSERLADAAGLRAGWRVLDVACGNGNAPLAAARCRTHALGVDFVPELLEGGRRRAAAERLDAEFRLGDAEDLPVPDASFDAVLSVFGAMFAPDHQRTAGEIARVTRPGGTVGLASWIPDGFV